MTNSTEHTYHTDTVPGCPACAVEALVALGDELDVSGFDLWAAYTADDTDADLHPRVAAIVAGVDPADMDAAFGDGDDDNWND